jgi:SAM-dependent MidA family methyltransferase
MSSLPHSFAKPDADALAHSERLRDVIIAAIEQAGGKIPFSQFMQLALYAPGLGYYSAGAPKFGAQGDFITAPEISPLFSYCLANQCATIMAQLTKPSIIEFGAGSGKMAADILQQLATLNALPECYYILEVSADLIQRQQQTIKAQCPNLFDNVCWLSTLPTEPLNAIVIANEVLDAMPVELFQQTAHGIEQVFVTYEDKRFNAMPSSVESAPLQTAIDNITQEYDFPEGYSSEINVLLAPWVHSLYEIIEQGVVLLIDYGYPRAEYYHPQRSQGTLQCFYRHQVHNDPFLLLGLQDITAHVDFTAVAEAAVDAGFSVLGFSNQATFLLNNDLLSLSTALANDEIARFNINQQIKQLTLPSEMGESFKVIGLAKQYNHPLKGFAFGDKLHLL